MYSSNGLGNASSHSNSLPSRLTADLPKNMIQSSPQVVHNRMQSDRHRGVAPLQGRARKNEMLREQRSRLAQWFYNLPVRQKILLGLTIPGIFSILVLIAVQYQFFVSEVRTHLVKQAKLELAVIEDEYNNKFEQMRISAHGRVENPLIIAAVQDDTVDAVATPEIRKDIKGILRGEVAELDIEYATLVGRNLRIIANANADRTGDVFNPDGLVSEALTAGRQIKTSSVVSWDELAKESSPLPDQFNRQDALIRYTATPVKAPNTKEVLGVLVLGDIVRHKFPTVKNTVNKWGDGYSGVYRLASDGELSLVASLAKDAKSDAPEINQAARDLAVVKAAATAKGGLVTKRLQLRDGSMHVMAAKAVLGSNNQPVAVLVRETAALEATGWIQHELRLQLILCGAIALFNLLLATMLARFITRPLTGLQKATHLFAAGNRWIRSKAYAKDEVGRLAVEFNKLADSVVRSETQLREQAQQQQIESQKTRLLLEEVARSQARTEPEIKEVFSRALVGTRKILEVDRLVIYRFDNDSSGSITTEAVGWNWPSALNQRIEDACIPKQLLDAYTHGRIAPISNVLNAGLHPDHLQLMERLQIKANLAAPILHEGQLFGLLIAHHCAKTHEWQTFEIDFMRQLAVQLGVARDRLASIQKREAAAERSRVLWDVNLQIISAKTTAEVMARLPLTQVRQALQADRILVYQFDQNGESAITAKSVSKGWLRALNSQPYVPCLEAGDVDKYRHGHIQAIPNIYEADLSGDRLHHLKTFAIKAKLVVPIRQEADLFGLLIAHQCDGPRPWEQPEIDFCQQVAAQIKLALGRCELISQRELAAESALTLAKRQQQQTEKWRRRLLELLSEVTQATAATQAINQIVETIQLETLQAIETIHQHPAQEGKGISLTGDAKQSLDKIVAMSRQIDQLAQSISEVTISQKSTALTAKHLMLEIKAPSAQS